ncbi:MAG: DUF4271 domain-containing protein [Bacteroidota bacterium]|nr:DUF4271 domain-containing protein [Bacteroidota bacterium]
MKPFHTTNFNQDKKISGDSVTAPVVYKEQTSKSIQSVNNTTFYAGHEEAMKNSQFLKFKITVRDNINKSNSSDIKASFDYGPLVIILTGFVVFAVLKNVFNYSVISITKKILNPRRLLQSKSEKVPLIINLFVYFLFFLSTTLLFIKLLDFSQLRVFDYSLLISSFILALLNLVVLLFIKLWNKIISIIFETPTFNYFNRITDLVVYSGVSLIFVSASALFLSEGILQQIFIILSLTALLLTVVGEVLLSVKIIYPDKLRFYYLFLYLCIFKIMPALIILKAFFLL